MALAWLALVLGAQPSFAHGVGQSYDLPLPLWLYTYGAGAVVLLSFLPISLFAGGGRRSGKHGHSRRNLLVFAPIRTVLTNRFVLNCARGLSVFLFALVVVSGFVGDQSEGSNLSPTFVWIIWWVGFSFFTAFVGNVWPLLSPWKVIFDLAQSLAGKLGVRLGCGVQYPQAWGVWPAVALYGAFVWVELVFEGAAVPLSISVLIVAYSIVTWGGMAAFGSDAWVRGGEAFAVYFGVLGRFAPFELRVNPERVAEREIELRLPAVGLAAPGCQRAGMVAFVVLMLAGVAYDGLLATPLWLEVLRLTPATQTIGLVVLFLLFLAAFLGFVSLSWLVGGGGVPVARLAAAYVYTLVPIAVAYQVSHYWTYLLIQGQAIISHVSDPLGLGWDLFGTAGYELRVGFLDVALVWYAQVALVVAGHVAAVYLAHVVSNRYFAPPTLAIRSQLPMLVLMILYTVASLWILSQPIVDDEASGREHRASFVVGVVPGSPAAG